MMTSSSEIQVKYLKHALQNKSLFKRAKELATILKDWGWISKV